MRDIKKGAAVKEAPFLWLNPTASPVKIQDHIKHGAKVSTAYPAIVTVSIFTHVIGFILD